MPTKRVQAEPWLSINPRNFGSHVTVSLFVHPPVRLHHRKTNLKSLALSSYFQSLQSYIAYRCCGQLTAVKPGHPLTSITGLYLGLRCRPRCRGCRSFLKLSADNLLAFNRIAGSTPSGYFAMVTSLLFEVTTNLSTGGSFLSFAKSTYYHPTMAP